MKKLFRRIGKIFFWTISGLLLFLVLLGGFIHTPVAQRFIAGKASAFLSGFIRCEVRINKLDFNLLKRTVSLTGLEVFDSRSNRTVFVPGAMVTIRDYNLKQPTLEAAALHRPQICIRRYEGDSMSDFKRILRQIAALPKKDTALRKAFVIENMRITDGSFLYDAMDEGYAPSGKIDFKHVGLSGVYLVAKDFYTRVGAVMADIRHLECTEKTGFRVDDFAAWVYVNRGEMKFASASVRTPESRVKMNLRFDGGDWKRYRNFVENVALEGALDPSVLFLADLGYFAPALQGMAQKLSLSGRVNGHVAGFALNDFKLGIGDSTRMEADLRLSGLPEIRKGSLDLRLKKLQVDRNDIDAFVLPNGKAVLSPSLLPALHRAEIQGIFSGNMRKFVADMEIRTNIGSLRLVNTARDTANGNVFMQGSLQAGNVRLDRLLESDTLLGRVALDAEFTMMGPDFKRMEYGAKGSVYDLEIADAVLRPLVFDIRVRKGFFEGSVRCHDPGLDFTLGGVVDLTSSLSRSRYELDLRNLDLSPLRFLGDQGEFTVKTRLSADHTGNSLESAVGELVLEKMEIARLGNTYYLDRFEVELDHADTLHRLLSVRSALFDADAGGYWDIKGLGKAFQRMAAYHLPNLGSGDLSTGTEGGMPVQDFNLSLRLKSVDSLLRVFYPSLTAPLGLAMAMHYASLRNDCRVEVEIPYVQMGQLAYMDGSFELFSDSGMLALRAQADKLYIDDSLGMHDFSVGFRKADTNALAYTISWGRDKFSPQPTNAALDGVFRFLPGNRMRVEMQDFDLQVDKTAWKSYPDGYVLIAKDSLVMHRVGIYSGDSAGGIRIEGELSRRPNSLLRVDFSDFDLAYLEFFLRKSMMKVDAKVDGYAEVHDFYGDFLFNSNLKFRSLSFNRRLYGTGVLETAFSRRDAVKVAFLIEDAVREKPSLWIDGTFYPRRQRKLDFDGYVSDLPIDFLDGILASATKDLDGRIDGKLGVTGTLSSPQFSARITSDSLSATIPMLETRYTFRDFGIDLSSESIVFKPSVFYDPIFKTEGKLDGRIAHRNFKDIRLDIGISFANLLALNTKRSPGLPFWGTVFATGKLGISGPTNDITMLLNAEVNDHSDISFDFSSPGGGSGANFITFLAPAEAVDSNRVSLEKLYIRNYAGQKRKGRLTMDLNLDITPGLAVSVGLRNTAMTGELKATGRGLLRLYMADGNPQLFGTYTVNDGEFDFSMVNLINKRFRLREGGTISWIGPMTDARIQVQAGYQTKASLYPVLASFATGESDVYKQKVNVESVILLSGNLMNPDIGFDIELSNVDEDTKDKFLSVIKKDDEDEMLRQTFSLLMFNTFMSVDGSSSDVANTALASSSEILFSQFNNFLSKLTTDFNVGLNYVPGSATSNSEFQVMMSGQLFNDRLVINGNLGVSDKANGSTSATTVVGDVDVEWKFTEELRLRGFNHSNDQDLTKPVNSYTQGVGILFRRDFDNGKEFLYGTKPRRSREEKRAERKKKREIRQIRQAGYKTDVKSD